MRLVVIEVDELMKIIREELREALRRQAQMDESGGVELAERLTGLKPDTIYKKVSNREIPFYQEVKGGKITFSRKELIDWQAKRWRRTRTELEKELNLK